MHTINGRTATLRLKKNLVDHYDRLLELSTEGTVKRPWSTIANTCSELTAQRYTQILEGLNLVKKFNDGHHKYIRVLSMENWRVEVANSVARKRISIPRDKVPTHVNGEFYATWIAEHEGLYTARWILWDIDRKNDPEDALRLTRLLVDTLLSQEVPEEALRIVFSTSKGFHVYLDSRTIGLSPCENLHDRLQAFCLQLAPFADESLYSRGRIVGIPNSRHRTTGLYYVPIPVEHIHSWEVEEMREYAMRPREFDAPYEEIEVVPDLQSAYSEPRDKVYKGFRVQAMSALIDRRERGQEYFKGVSEGSRNRAMYELAASCRRKELKIEMTRVLVLDANSRNVPPLPADEVVTVINSAYKNTGERI